jgi:FkbM family methyltransferase
MNNQNKWLQPAARWFCRQRWIRFGIRDHIARYVENPDTTKGSTFKQPFFGGVYTGNTGNFIDWSARYFGSYAIEELELLGDVAAASEGPFAAVDIGANVGNHSLYLGLKRYDGRILAFEPNPGAMALLTQKLKANPQARILAIQKALSNKSGRLLLSLPDHANIGVASLEKAVGSRSVTVDVCRGDDVAEIDSLPQINVIKIDVEGHELQVLAGLKRSLAKHYPAVFFEWQGGSIIGIQPLFPEGYNFYRFRGDQNLGFFFARPGYGLQLLPPDCITKLVNILAWPPNRLLPANLSARLFR